MWSLSQLISYYSFPVQQKLQFLQSSESLQQSKHIAKERQLYFQTHRLTLKIAPDLEFLSYFYGRTMILEWCLSQNRTFGLFFAYNILGISLYH